MVGVAYIPRKPLAKMARPQTRTSKRKVFDHFELQTSSSATKGFLNGSIPGNCCWIAIATFQASHHPCKRVCHGVKNSGSHGRVTHPMVVHIVEDHQDCSLDLGSILPILSCQCCIELDSQVIHRGGHSPARVERSRLGFRSSSSSSVSLSAASS